ncbi:MAG: PhoH family protein [Pseudomonadota bacterium]
MKSRRQTPRKKSDATSSEMYPVKSGGRLLDLCGPHHSFLQFIEHRLDAYDVTAESQGGAIFLSGGKSGVSIAIKALAEFERRLDKGAEPTELELKGALEAAMMPARRQPGDLPGLPKSVSAQTPGQASYLNALMTPDAGLIFGTGPAGTGKTYLAMAVAVSELLSGVREKIIVTRPAVEAGENLGFLPGDLEEKVDPYMLPIWDALNEFMGKERVEKAKLRGEIEVAPLAFMRGRTLKKAFIVVDEAQNATIPQMKMVLTRLGRQSRMVVTGDPGQVDLPNRQPSGLAHALRILADVPEVTRVRLTARDVVRHDLVSQIIDAYDRHASETD